MKLFLIFCLILSSCSSSKKETTEDNIQKISNYETISLTIQKYKPTLKVAVIVKPIEQNFVSFDIPGIIETVNATEGETVKVGTELATLEANKVNYTVEKLKDNVASARRRYILYGTKESKEEYDKLNKELTGYMNILTDSKLYVPLDGIVGKINFTVGDKIAPGEVFATIYDISQVKLILKPENESYSLINDGYKVTIYPPSPSEGSEQKVEPISTLITKTEGEILLYLNNKDHALKPNVSVVADIDVPEQNKVVIIPKQLVNRNRYILLELSGKPVKFYLTRYAVDNYNFIVYEDLPSYKLIATGN